MCRMNPRVSPQHQVATVNQVPGMQDNAGGRRGREGCAFGPATGEKQKASKGSGCDSEAIVGAAMLSVLQERRVETLL